MGGFVLGHEQARLLRSMGAGDLCGMRWTSPAPMLCGKLEGIELWSKS